MKKTIKFLSFVLCMAMLFAACGAKAPLSKEQAVKFADKDVLCLVNKDYEAVAGGFNESIAKQVDATALQQAWESVVSTASLERLLQDRQILCQPVERSLSRF